MKVESIDHITIRVRDLKKAIAFFADLFETRFTDLGEFKEQGIRMSIDPLGIGIAEPLTPDSPLAKAIDKRGEGLSVISLMVADIEKAVAEAKARGIRLIGRQEETKFRTAILHPADTFGAMIELIQWKAAAMSYGIRDLKRTREIRAEKLALVAIRVKDIQKAVSFFTDLLETKFTPFGEFKEIDVVSFIDPMGVEIVGPLTTDGPTARALAKSGEGLAMVSFQVPDLAEAVAEMAARGIRLVTRLEDKLSWAAIFHPKDTYNVLIELLQWKPQT
ncbi:MAG: VOC family protein [Chloroflexi bacterium]|nr:VOC family protein [Chloroflexota bacterium]